MLALEEGGPGDLIFEPRFIGPYAECAVQMLPANRQPVISDTHCHEELTALLDARIDG